MVIHLMFLAPFSLPTPQPIHHPVLFPCRLLRRPIWSFVYASETLVLSPLFCSTCSRTIYTRYSTALSTVAFPGHDRFYHPFPRTPILSIPCPLYSRHRSPSQLSRSCKTRPYRRPPVHGQIYRGRAPVSTPRTLYKIPIIHNGLPHRTNANCLRPLRKGKGQMR